MAKNAVTVNAVQSVSSIVNNNLKKMNGIVMGTIVIQVANVTANSWKTIGTISEKPGNSMSFVALITSDGSFGGMVSIDTDGNIKLYCSQTFSTSKNVCAELVYAVA